MSGNKYPLTGIRIPENLKQQLKHIAERENRSLNNLINVILADYCLKYQTEKDKPSE